jgi:Kef-type K+ transport system membrane component KefB
MTTQAVLVVRSGPFLAVIGAAAIAATLAALASGRGFIVPAGHQLDHADVVVGPHVLGLRVDEFLSFFSDLGLALLFFFAGYEIDLGRIGGLPLRLALIGWVMSLVLAYAIAGALALAGVVISALYTGSALTTTAIGTLIPILSDSGELRTRFGTFMLAAGAVGEFGPVLVLTLVLSAQGTLRWILVLIFALVLLAFHLGLDLLLGGFAAGIIARHTLGDAEARVFNSKLTAISFGVFVPFFFVVSGMRLDLPALFGSFGAVAKMALFLLLFLVVRGVPALVLYRTVLGRRDRLALALMSSTQLPLVLAITALAITDHHMRASTAAALVGGAVLSTLFFPVLGLRLRGDLHDEAQAAR